MERIEILGVQIDNVTADEVVRRVGEMIESGAPHQIVTPAVDQIIRCRHDPEFNLVVTEADLVAPDGMPVVFASKLHKTPLKERVTGVDLVPRVCELAVRRGYGIFFFGGEEGVADETARVLSERFPGLRVAGTYYPPYRFEENPEAEREAIEAVRAAKPDVLFVALSSPRQEKWIRRRKAELGVPVMVGVGGAFNFITGREKRAPQWLQNIGLEGVYRMFLRPREIWKRIFISAPYFLLLLFDRLSYAQQKRVARWARPLLLAAVDAALAPAAFLFSYWLYFRSTWFAGAQQDPFPGIESLLDMPAYSDLLVFVALLGLPAVWLSRLYGRDKYAGAKTLVARSAKAAALAVFFLIGFQFVFKDIFVQYRLQGYSRVVFGFFGIAFFLALAGWRLLFRAFEHFLRGKRLFLDRMIVAGRPENMRGIVAEMLARPEHGNYPLGWVSSGPDRPGAGGVPGIPNLGTVDDLERLLPARKVDLVLAVDPDMPLETLEKILRACHAHRVPLSMVPSMHTLLGASSFIEPLGGRRVITLRPGRRELDRLNLGGRR